MEEALTIFDYLPIIPPDNEYIQFLWETFEINYNNEKYQFSFIAFHMLFMCFVYFKIWQIQKYQVENFKIAMIGFSKDIENEFMKSNTPFIFHIINESTIFRFFKLIGFDNSDIGRFVKIIKERNDSAHTNGNIYYRNKENLDVIITEILFCIKIIQEKSKQLIERIYNDFLDESANIEEREYTENIDQIREIFIRKNYISLEDIKIAKTCDISELVGDGNVFSLINTPRKMYQEDE